jgi:hypothetical protein
LIGFNARDMFRNQYRMPCLVAFEQCCNSTDLARAHCLSVEHQMCELARTLQHEDTTSSHLRTEILKAHSFRWSPLRTNKTCLRCLRRKPEHLQPCGHSLCDACVMMLGTGNPGVEYCFNITTCFLCQSHKSFTARLKPPSAGVRILSIDGGGTRGVVPWESICLLQGIVGKVPVRELFDLKVGTSSGNLADLQYMSSR